MSDGNDGVQLPFVLQQSSLSIHRGGRVCDHERIDIAREHQAGQLGQRVPDDAQLKPFKVEDV